MSGRRLNGADRVVDCGTSGIWTWRKWESGAAECWGTYTASIAVATASGSYSSYRSGSIGVPAWPAGLFCATPTVTATSLSSGGVWVNHAEATPTSLFFYLSCGASLSAASRSIGFHAFGRWK